MMKNTKTTKQVKKPVNKKSNNEDLGFFEIVGKHFNYEQSKVIYSMARALEHVLNKVKLLESNFVMKTLIASIQKKPTKKVVNKETKKRGKKS